MTRYRYDHGWVAQLVGKSVVEASEDTLTLSDGMTLQFERSNSDCCSWFELKSLTTTDNIITHAEIRDNEDDTNGDGEYRAWVHVIAGADELTLVDGEGDATNGYYLHGFALGVKVTAGASND